MDAKDTHKHDSPPHPVRVLVKNSKNYACHEEGGEGHGDDRGAREDRSVLWRSQLHDPHGSDRSIDQSSEADDEATKDQLNS